MAWTFDSVKALIEAQENRIVESEGDCLRVSNDEGTDVFVYAGEQQILVETPLFPLVKVSQPEALNQLVLRTHQLLPLTTIGIKHIGDEDYYVAFGSLSIDSKDTVVLEEIETLFLNVAEFMELYSDYLIQEVAA